MYWSLISAILALSFSGVVSATPAIAPPKVIVNENQVITGKIEGDLETFKGIPFAQPPIGKLRFRRPQKYNHSYGGFAATSFGPSCIEIDSDGSNAKLISNLNSMKSYLPAFLSDLIPKAVEYIGNNSEDCLTISVSRPNGTTFASNLPVMVSIYGGAFQSGTGSMDPKAMISESVKMNQPIIFVTFNYRLGPWGFLGGSAVLEEGNTNVGLHDQRQALEWIQDHISSFGGDKTQVMIFGESAGAMSVAHQMVAYGGDNSYNGGKLFTSAIMQSGGITPMKEVDSMWPEKMYQVLAKEAGCGVDSTDSGAATMDCLRSKSTKEIIAAQNSQAAQSFFSIVGAFFGWSPHTDGDILPYSAFDMIKDGNFTQIPYITGTQEDEGTAFGLILKDVNTEDKWRATLATLLGYQNSSSEIDTLLSLYPMDPTVGAPFRTGKLNNLTPQFKRISALITDFLFESPRRWLLHHTPSHVPSYTYLASPLHGIVPILGSYHANDLLFQFILNIGPYLAYRRYWISFANHHDPNIGTGLARWNPYTTVGNESLSITFDSLRMRADNFRLDQINHLMYNSSKISA